MENKEANPQNETQTSVPEALKVDESQLSTASIGGDGQAKSTETTKRKRLTYRPSHKGTFIGLAVISLFLIANVVGLWYLLRSQSDTQEELINNGVTLSSESLSQLGLNRDTVGGATELTVGPNATFRGNLAVGENVSIGGNLQLNSDFVSNSAKITNLQASDLKVEEINVNGDGTISTLNLREDLNVTGTARFQGQAVFSQLTTINNNLNVAGSLSVGGSFASKTFEASDLRAGQVLSIGGHVITEGSPPSMIEGSTALGSGGTASVNGTDTAGIVAVNIGTGSGAGLIGSVTFNRAYSETPSVVVSPVGHPMPGLYVNRTTTGFTVSTSSALPPGSYAIDYIVMQ